MKLLCKVLFVVFPTLYIIATVYVAYHLLYKSGGTKTQQIWLEQDNVLNVKSEDVIPQDRIEPHIPPKPAPLNVEIWGKAAISIYLWKHILKGELFEVPGGIVSEGHLSTEDVTFTFRYGPGIIQSTVPADVKNLVLVLNGRSADKIATAKQWLDHLPRYSGLKHTVLMLLGDEQCENSWLLPYMRSNGGSLDAVLLVYDSVLVDDKEFFQWPLGVATYRGFPDFSTRQDIDLTSPRSHLCNFLGTVYSNSSRQTLVRLLDTPALQDECILRAREKWVLHETDESRNSYLNALLKSDLTLSPVGMNTECYRIYEAFALGSIPVVEDVVTPGKCDNRSRNAPLRLLKKHNAPFILIKDWYDLPHILYRESQRSLNEKIERRMGAVQWYSNFKKSMKQEFIRILKMKFSH